MLVRPRHVPARRIPRPWSGQATPLRRDGAFPGSTSSLSSSAKTQAVTSRKGAEALGMLQAHSPTAKKLHDGEFWQPRLNSKKSADPTVMPPTDTRRVNIVSEKLCGSSIALSTAAYKDWPG